MATFAWLFVKSNQFFDFRSAHPPLMIVHVFYPLSEPQVRELSVLYVEVSNSPDFARQVLQIDVLKTNV